MRCFCACKVYIKLDRQLKNQKSNLSPEKVIDILKNIYAIVTTLPKAKEKKLMLPDKVKEQQSVFKKYS